MKSAPEFCTPGASSMVMTGLCDREEVKTSEGFISHSHCSEVMHRSREVGGLLPLPCPVPVAFCCFPALCLPCILPLPSLVPALCSATLFSSHEEKGRGSHSCPKRQSRHQRKCQRGLWDQIPSCAANLGCPLIRPHINHFL